MQRSPSILHLITKWAALWRGSDFILGICSGACHWVFSENAPKNVPVSSFIGSFFCWIKKSSISLRIFRSTRWPFASTLLRRCCPKRFAKPSNKIFWNLSIITAFRKPRKFLPIPITSKYVSKIFRLTWGIFRTATSSKPSTNIPFSPPTNTANKWTWCAGRWILSYLKWLSEIFFKNIMLAYYFFLLLVHQKYLIQHILI